MATDFSVSTNVNTEAASKAIAQVGHGFTVGTPVRRTSGSYVTAQADSLANSLCDGIVTGVPGADSFVLTSNGYASGLSGFTDGDQYYLSPTAAGTTTTTRTSTVGQFIKPLFKAISATEIIVLIGESEEVQAAAGGGNVVLIDSGTLSGASQLPVYNISSAYSRIEIELNNINEGTAATTIPMIRTSPDTGVTPVWDAGATDYDYVLEGRNTAGTPKNGGAAAQGAIQTAFDEIGSAAGADGSLFVKICNPTNASTKTKIFFDYSFQDASGNLVHQFGTGQRAAAGATNAVRVYPLGGSFSCIYEVRGYKNT